MSYSNTVYQKWHYSGKGTVDSRDGITVKLSYCHHRCFFGFSGDSMKKITQNYIKPGGEDDEHNHDSKIAGQGVATSAKKLQ